MADTQNINAVTDLQSIDGNDSILVSDSNTSLGKINYNKLAKAIIESYTGSSLAGSGQSIQSAFNVLNSNKQNFSGVINDTRLPSANQQIENVLIGTSRNIMYLGNNDTVDDVIVQTKSGNVSVPDLNSNIEFKESGTIQSAIKEAYNAGKNFGHFIASRTLSDSPESTNDFIVIFYKQLGSNVVYIEAVSNIDPNTKYVTRITSVTSSGDTMSAWTKVPTRAEVETLNSKKSFQQIHYGDAASVTFTVGSGSRHLLVIASSGAQAESAIIFVSATNAGGIAIGEAYKGINITSIVTNVNNRVTINWSATGNRFYFDCVLAGNVMALV